MIPATRAAAEMMDRRFGVRRDRPSSGGEGEVGTLDYELEPIVVDGGSHCSDPTWTRGEDGVCRSTRGGGGDGGGTGDDGGGGADGGGGGAPEAAPEGIDQERYNRLNETEKKMCWANTWECGNMFVAAIDAENWSTQQTSEGAHNGPQDALRHAKWNANMTKSIGSQSAKAWADAHEVTSTSTDAAETRMDLHNNAVGRQIGDSWSDAAAGVTWAWETGQLCLYVGSC